MVNVRWLLPLSLTSLACEPTFDDRNSEILERRVLAVKVAFTEPSPLKLGATVELRIQPLLRQDVASR